MIRVLPRDEVGGNRRLEVVAAPIAADLLAWAPSRTFVASGRSGLDAILRSLGLGPGDDVLITNSTGQTYVSSCVTCTVFNHCRPSRVLGDRTRAILVIHEYGFPHPALRQLLEIAEKQGIPVIEDCAHSLDSELDGMPLGSFGDFAIFSLPKVLPVAAGGILVAAKTDATGICEPSTEAEAAYRKHLPVMGAYSQRRRHNYAAVRERFPEVPVRLEAGPGVTPWYVPLVTERAREIKDRSAAVEWGSTLDEDLLLVTTNPLVETEALVDAVERAFEVAQPA